MDKPIRRRNRPRFVRCRCHYCGAVEMARGGSQYFRCAACHAAGVQFARHDGARYLLGGDSAGGRVHKAIRDGALPHPSLLACTDCGAAAEHYDHRDYNKPLVVEAVCRSCNFKRGPAIPWRGAIEVLLDRGIAPYTTRARAGKLFSALGMPAVRIAALPPRLTVEHWRDIWPELAAQEA